MTPLPFFTQFSTRTVAWLLLTFFVCLHNQLQFYTFYHRVLKRVQMFEESDSWNRREKWMVAPFSKFSGKIWVGFCLNNGKRFPRGFILKPIERAYVLLKNRTRDFPNGPPFERLAYFYVPISGNFERLQYFNFETDFLQIENIFQKIPYRYRTSTVF